MKTYITESGKSARSLQELEADIPEERVPDFGARIVLSEHSDNLAELPRECSINSSTNRNDQKADDGQKLEAKAFARPEVRQQTPKARTNLSPGKAFSSRGLVAGRSGGPADARGRSMSATRRSGGWSGVEGSIFGLGGGESSRSLGGSCGCGRNEQRSLAVGRSRFVLSRLVGCSGEEQSRE